ncbi:MAG: hypothetical protein IPK29_19115 [Betaproteobacteria bacterium]|nr:hypothetical protein [Betaproteobacteria bacterium]
MRRAALRSALALLACAAAALPAGAQAQSAQSAQSAQTAAGGRGAVVIELKGFLRTEVVAQLRQALEGADRERFPAGAILLLDSPGGEAEVGMQIGRMARAANAHAFVRGRCASACVLILAGSVLRAAPTGAVGLHRPQLALRPRSGPIVPLEAGDRSGSDPRAVALLDEVQKRMQAYLEEMGMPGTLWEAIMAVPAGGTRYLTREELKSYGLLGFDADYARMRAGSAARRLNLPEEEYARRTLDTQNRCVDAAPAQSATEFARCYRRTLEAP